MAKGKICPGCTIERSASSFGRHTTCSVCRAIGLTVAAPPEEPTIIIDDPLIQDLQQFPTVEIDYEHPSIQELAARTLARRSLLHFILRFKPKYMPGWVHKDICRRLERFMKQVEEGKEPRLLLMMPVRHGKSEIASRHFAPFVLGHHPDWEIIAASGAQSLAMSFSRYIRDLVRDPAYGALFPNMKLDPSSQSVENWNTTLGGGYLAAGIGTMITGRGCLRWDTVLHSHSNGCILPVSEIKVGDYVYGYDHKNQQYKPVRVIAVSASRTRRSFVRVGDIECTDDHEFCTSLAGSYTRASDLETGMSVMRRAKIQKRKDMQDMLQSGAEKAHYSDRQSMSFVRREESRACSAMQKVPYGRSAVSTDNNARVRTLRSTVSAQIVRARRKFTQVWGAKHVLFEGVLRKASQAYDALSKSMPALWGATKQGASDKVLFAQVLFSEPSAEYEVVQSRVFSNEKEAADSKETVCVVRTADVSPGDTSYRRECGEQRADKLGAVMLSVSQVISHVEGVSACMLASRVDGADGELVVDLQTESGNFFAGAEGLLVHNCHILVVDDPVKDAEAADSQTQRDNTWEWYMSTAYTRLAPGGGVLGIMCMTGDTPVMMADGSQRRLDSLMASDEIATYARGTLARTTVAAVRSSGRDSVYRIMMKSGRIVRANERHPFLTVAPSGELSWTRLKNLSTALRIVTVKGSGVSGEALPALPRGATCLPCVADFAPVTMRRNAGQMGTERSLTERSLGAMRNSNTSTGSRSRTTMLCMRLKEAVARFVGGTLTKAIALATGRTSSRSTTATTPVKSEGCCAIAATPGSGTLLMSQWHLPPLGISDFTLEEIASIELDGVEEVFDVQVNDTENFIANGLVSHNTWWNEDDWAGRIQQSMKTGDGDMFEIVKYPAINELGDEYLLPDDTMIELPKDSAVPEGATLLRPHMSALHPDRYTLDSLLKRKASYYALGQQRWWAALYQQNPTPEEGAYFTKGMFKTYEGELLRRGKNVFQAWDFAITEGEQNDWTVGCTLLQDEHDNLYVLDVKRFRQDDGIELMDTIVEYAKEWQPDLIGFEDGQIWKALESTFKRTCEVKQYYPAWEVLKPFTDKLVRAQPLRGRMQAGKLYWPKKAAWYDELRSEFLRFPAGKHDDQVDACFVAGTLVSLPDGTCCEIERIQPGDYVATPQGACLVLAAGPTDAGTQPQYELELSDGTVLVGTGSHPIATARGWIALDALMESDIIYDIASQEFGGSSWHECMLKPQQTLIEWSSTGGTTAATLILYGPTSESTTAAAAGVGSSIAMSGSTITGLFRRAITYTTKTAIHLITTSRTLSASIRSSTQRSIKRVVSRMGGRRNSSNTYQRSGLSQSRGTPAKKDARGIGSTAPIAGKPQSIARSVASCVVQSFRRVTTKLSGSAGGRARTRTGAANTLSMKRRSALEQKHVVYNLTVAEAHCYYANSVLVHNCAWAVRLTLSSSAPRPPAPKQEKSWRDKMKKYVVGEGGGYMAS